MVRFNYTGEVQEFIATKRGAYKVQCWGAQGGHATYGGKGAYTEGIIFLQKNEKLFIYVGGQGTDVAGGFNGGGAPGSGKYFGDPYGGGGATDVRTSTTLESRIIVAGGGGGGQRFNDSGQLSNGYGGSAGSTSKNGVAGKYWCCGTGGGGASMSAGGTAGTNGTSATTSSTAGSLGEGGRGGNNNTYQGGAGGGGGYYGGGAGGPGCGGAAGGGGSSYINSTLFINPISLAGSEAFNSPDGSPEAAGHSGNGCVIIDIGEKPLVPLEVYDFNFTGASQVFTVPRNGVYRLECWGAQGGSYSSRAGGKGGYSKGELVLSKGTVLYCFVGGTTTGESGGFNGGGKGYAGGPGGGGSSDIRTVENSLYSRIIVAGAGGGAMYAIGGYGGGLKGAAPDNQGEIVTSSNRGGGGGTQTEPGVTWSSGWKASFGKGGDHQAGGYENGGGGSGWYGGAAGYDNDSDDDGKGGGGGSGYVYTAASAINYPSGCLLNETHYLLEAELKSGGVAFIQPDGSTATGKSGNGHIRITSYKSATPPFRVKTISGEWVESTASLVNINGEWKEISAMFVNINGVWKEGV